VERAGRLVTGAVIVVGAFVLCAGIPLGVLYLLARLGWSFLPAVAFGLTIGPLAMIALGMVLARLEEVHARLGPPAPPGLEPGSALLEGSIVTAVVVTIAAIAVWLIFFSGGGGTFGPFPG
jgi:hypothetical protein